MVVQEMSMKDSLLPPDDLPPSTATPLDRLLRLRLQETAGRRFFEGCDRITQTILSRCRWAITANPDIPTLSITCADTETYWYIISNLEEIATSLRTIADLARIQIYPPIDGCTPMQLDMDELPSRDQIY